MILSQMGDDPFGSQDPSYMEVNGADIPNFKTYTWKIIPLRGESEPDMPLIEFSYLRPSDAMDKDTTRIKLTVLRTNVGAPTFLLDNSRIRQNDGPRPAQDEPSNCTTI